MYVLIIHYKRLHVAQLRRKKLNEILNVQPLTGEIATKQGVLRRMESVALIWSMHIAAHGIKETGKIALASNPGWQFKTSLAMEEDNKLY